MTRFFRSAVLVGLLGCSAPPVQTSTGAVVPAHIVITQDAVSDVLNTLTDLHNQSVRAFRQTCPVGTAEPACEVRRLELSRSGAAIRLAIDGVIGWKVAGGRAPADLFCPVAQGLQDSLDLARAYGAPESVDAALRPFLAALARGCS